MTYKACTRLMIDILHQTTTRQSDQRDQLRLYLIEILHQTTTSGSLFASFQRVIQSSRSENRMRKRRRSEFDVFFVFQRTKILFF